MMRNHRAVFTLYLAEALECRMLLSTYYVGTTGSDATATPTNPLTPYLTIQKAATIVNPGDTVIVQPGVYYGPINLTRNGTAAAPIIFKADAIGQNRVVITNANKQIREKQVTWTLEDASLKMYSAPENHFPERVLYDGVDLLSYTSLANLKAFKMGVNLDYPGTPDGYFYDSNSGKLYVRLRADEKYGSVDPNQHIMAVAPPPGGGGKGYDVGRSGTLYNFGILSESAANVVIDGFSFETPGVACVFVRASNVTVRNCWFRGAKTGVSGGKFDGEDPFSSDNIIVEYCDWNQFPTYSDAVEIIHQYSPTWFLDPAHQDGDWKFFWWQRKGQSDDKWLDSNMDYESPGMTERMGKNWIIRNNHIYECFDGIGTYAMEGMDGAQIYNNIFERIVDNAIEFENHGRNIRVFKNEFIDCYMPISWQPLGGTPWPTNIWMYDNIIYDNPGVGEMWKNEAQYRGAWLKIGAAEKQWAWYDWMTNVPKTPVNPGEQGMWFYNNTIYTPGKQFLEKINSNSMAMEGVYFYNNIFAVEEHYISARGTPQVVEGNYATMTYSHNLRSTDTVVTYAPDPVVSGTGGKTFNDPTKLGLANPAVGDFTLTAASPARGAGVAVPGETAWSTDAGAIPFGTTWVHPVVSPQASAPTIPGIPASLVATPENAQVSLSWVAATGAATYNVKRSTTSGGPYTTVASNLSATTYIDTGLVNGTTYYYVVSAKNAAGEGQNSSQAGATPAVPATAPAAPSGLAAVAASTSQINLNWVDASGNETGFKIDYSTSSTFASGVTTLTLNTANATSYSVTGLAAGTTYYFRVRATNAVGDSLNSNTATTATQTAPTSGVAINFANQSDYTNNFREVGNYTGNIGWDASGVVAMSHTQNWRTGVAIYDTTPADGQTNVSKFGGSATPEVYSIDFRIGTSGGVKLFARVPNPTVAGGYYLRADTSGLGLRIPTTAAVPDNENDLASTAASLAVGTWYTLQFTVQNNAANTAVILMGKVFAQGNTSGTPLATVSYTHNSPLYIAAGQTGFAASSGGTAAPNGTTNIDNFTVNSGTVTPPPVAPAAPTGLTATATSTSQINLAWTDAATNETGFKVDYSTSSTFASGVTSVSINTPNAASTSITGLAASTTYYFRVRATNAVSDSGNSNTANATTQAVVLAPAAPSALAATAASTSQINLTWTDNASNETGFKVDYSTSSTFASGVTTVTINTANATSTSISGLAASTTYYFRVRATNATGDSGNSNSANAATQAPPSSATVDINFASASDYDTKFREVGNYAANIGWHSSGVVAMSHTQNWRNGTAFFDTTPADGQTTVNTFGGTTTPEQYSIDFRVGTSGLVKLFARVANPTISGGYYVLADVTNKQLALRIPTSAASPDNEVNLAQATANLAVGTWYTLQFTVQNGVNGSVVLTGKVFAQGNTAGTPISTVTYTHTTNTYTAAGQVGFSATSGGTTAPSGTTNIDNFKISAPASGAPAAFAATSSFTSTAATSTDDTLTTKKKKRFSVEAI